MRDLQMIGEMEFLRWLITTRGALRLLIGLVYLQWSDSLGYLLTMNV